MMKVGCKDMGMDCPFTATADTEEELVKKMKDHAKMSHKDAIETMSDDDFKSKIADKMQTS